MGHKNSKITNKVYTHLSEQKAHEVNIITKTIDTKNLICHTFVTLWLKSA